MHIRWRAACGIPLLLVSSALAQLGSGAPDTPERPVELPPLLTPPAATAAPTAVPGPAGLVGEYDHGHLYLPQYAPARTGPEDCRPLGRWWVNTTFELAWIPNRPATRSIRLPIPVGAASIPGPILPVAGVESEEFQGGFGLTLGRWFGQGNRHGVEASLFTLGGPGQTFDAIAPGMLMIFPNGPDRSVPQVLLLPPPLANQIATTFPATLATWFIGADVNYRHTLYCNSTARLDALVGYRFAGLQDELYLGTPPDSGSDAYQYNRLAVTNAFNGGQLGLAGEYRTNSYFVSGVLKVAFGAVMPEISASGLFMGTQSSDDSGGYQRLTALCGCTSNQFAVLPTLNLSVGRQIRQRGRLFAGYTFQYLSNVTRLSDVLDTTGGSTPATTDFWVQSLNIGFELRF